MGWGGPISKESSILLHNVIKAWARVLLANRLKSQRVKTRIIFQEKNLTEVSNNQPCVIAGGTKVKFWKKLQDTAVFQSGWNVDHI